MRTGSMKHCFVTEYIGHGFLVTNLSCWSNPTQFTGLKNTQPFFCLCQCTVGKMFTDKLPGWEQKCDGDLI